MVLGLLFVNNKIVPPLAVMYFGGVYNSVIRIGISAQQHVDLWAETLSSLLLIFASSRFIT